MGDEVRGPYAGSPAVEALDGLVRVVAGITVISGMRGRVVRSEPVRGLQGVFRFPGT